MQATLKTEDTGKIVEKAICDLIETPFGGKFKYAQEDVDEMILRLGLVYEQLVGYVHTGNVDNVYDFKKGERGLSVKTNKHNTDWKVCPQIIGQTTKKRFSAFFGLPDGSSVSDIKTFITTNTVRVLEAYVEKTFHCDVLYYNKGSDQVLWIEKISPLSFEGQELTFSHTEKQKDWNESTTLYMQGKALGEFQIHTHRDGVKFRFNLKSVLEIFKDSFRVSEF